MKYGSLRTIATIFKVLAWLVLVLGIVGSLITGAGAKGIETTVMLIIMGLAGSFLYFLLLLAAAEAIYVILDIEQNTRETTELLRKGGST